MKRSALCILGVIAVSVSVFAQGQGGRGPAAPPPPLEPGASQADVDTALLAAPAQLKDQATVVKWKPDFTYTTLRKGTNRLVCFDKSGAPLQAAVSIECTSMGNMDRVAQNMKIEAMGGGDRAKAQAMFDAAEKDGTRVKPEFGSVWYHVFGMDKDHLDRDHTRTHMTIAVPGATAQSLGLPDKGGQGGVWIMNAGTSTAHLMVPGE
jgi:hypothetical protein